MSVCADMIQTVTILDRRDELIKLWKVTPERDDESRQKICKEMEQLFELRKVWQRKHPPSYNYATSRGLIANRRGVNQWGENDNPEDIRSDQAKIAEARTWLHEWCAEKKVGYYAEMEAGSYLINLMRNGVTQSEALLAAKMKIDNGQ